MKKQINTGRTLKISLLMVLSLFIISLCVFKVVSNTVSAATKGEYSSHLIVLVYHGITNENEVSNSSFLTVEDFERQMRYLHENNYQTLGLKEFLACHKKGQFPKKSVMITFDDGYKNFMDLAYPVLKEYKLRSVIFPIVGLTPGLAQETAWNKHLTFHDLRLMDKESGLIDIGSHTYSLHYYGDDGLAAISFKKNESSAAYKARIKQDLYVSKGVLELQTGKNVVALAWPYGVTNRTAVKVAKDIGYQMLFTLRKGVVNADTPLDRIPRYAVYSGSLEDFKKILANK